MESTGVTPRVWVDASDLAELAKDPGPFLTLVLAVDADVDNAAQRNDVRWRAVRDDLAARGVPDSVLEVVDGLVPDAHHQGQSLAVVAAPSGARHVEHWPAPPVRPLARWAPLPSLLPFVEHRQDAPAHVLVVADRQGADLIAVRHGAPDVEVAAGGQEEALPKVHAGGWSERRYQERAEASWADNARHVARRVAALARQVDARLVVVAGDVRAVQMIRADLPAEVSSLVAVADGSRAADGGPAVDPGELARLVAEVTARDTAALVEKLAEEVGQHDRGRAGVAGTLAALAAAQVEVLLVGDDPDDDRTAWFSSDPLVVAARRAELEGLADRPQEGRLADVAVRAALAGGAGVRVVPAGPPLEAGMGAVLRWS